APAPHAADEVGEVIAARPAARSGALLRSEPALVGEGVFSAGRQVPFRSVEDVADRVAPSQQSASNPRFVVRDPMPDVELQDLSRPAGLDELEHARERVRRLLVVVEHEMAADRGDSRREPDAEAPPREIDLVHALVAEVSIAGIPDPVPVVVKAVARERLEWRRPGPQVVIDPARNRFHRRPPDRVASLEAQPARQVDAAERAVVKMPDRVDRGTCGTKLCPVLHDAAVLFGGTHQLPALPEIVRARLLDVDVLA